MEDKVDKLYSKELFEQAMSYLTLNCSFVRDLGLFHGKMGFVLFFASYGKLLQNELYENFAGELIDEIYGELNFDISIGFESGLCGIGWGIEFLVQNGYMAGNTDDILEVIDNRILEYDISHITDLSFRRGVAGIAYYVLARLTATRKEGYTPFNNVFLDNLKEVLLCANFLKTDEVPPFLLETYLNVLNKSGKVKMELPPQLCVPTFEFPDDFLSLPFDLENGMAGILLYWTLNGFITKNVKKNEQGKQGLFIFNQKSRASEYGIGTYIQQLTEAVEKSEWHVTIIHLLSYETKTLQIEQKGNVQHIYVADIDSKLLNFQRSDLTERYCRNVLLLLNPYLKGFTKHLFHLNYLEISKLVDVLKGQFPQSKVVITVHYTGWSFALLGNRLKLQKILSHPDEKENESLYKSIVKEKSLFASCDKIIAIALHSYKDLLNIYEIAEDKLVLIPHGLKDMYTPLSKIEKERIRSNFGFLEDEKIMIFAGRIDSVKGVDILAETFAGLSKEYPQLRLIVAGSGSYNEVLTKVTPFWSKVIFTGFIEKNILYDLFSISNVGVLPSLHEEFGYVALEMMMMGLPLVVGQTTGLSELVIDGETGLTVALDKETKECANVFALKKAIKHLLDSSSTCQMYAANGRKRYLQDYSFDQFKMQILDFYKVSYGDIEV